MLFTMSCACDSLTRFYFGFVVHSAAENSYISADLIIALLVTLFSHEFVSHILKRNCLLRVNRV